MGFVIILSMLQVNFTRSNRLSYAKLNLISENSIPIIGVKLIDGSTAEFECFYNPITLHQDWIIPKHMIITNDCFIFVDSAGNEWTLHPDDIVFNSLLNNPKCMG
jgi:hypothetical protein